MKLILPAVKTDGGVTDLNILRNADAMHRRNLINRRFKIMTQITKTIILRIISIAFLIGGIGRLIATEGVFKLFDMQHLWSDQPFFIYNYKALAVFVIWVGIILFICSKDIVKYKSIIRGSILGLAIFFLVSLLTGILIGLGLRFYLVDSTFSLILIILFYIIQTE
ncbi:MAG: hypothetical protein ACE5K2_01495 [Candidatus Zixiibacteriota bacterium]